MWTAAGWQALLLGAALIGAGRVFGLVELVVVGTVPAAAAVGALMVRRLRPSYLSVSRSVTPYRVPVGEAARVEMAVLNRSRSPWRSPILRISDSVTGADDVRLSVAPLAGGRGAKGAYRLPAPRRGVIEIGPMRIDDLDPFGLARRSHRVPNRVRLVVHPPIEALPVAPLRTGDEPLVGEQYQQSSPGSSSDEIDGLRPYVDGDDPRRIHWSSTARCDELIVRQYRPPHDVCLTVIIDTRPPGHLEWAQDATTSVAASVAEATLAAGDAVRVRTTDGRGTPVLAGPGRLDEVLEFLALLKDGENRIHPDAGAGRSTGVAVTADPSAASDPEARSRLVRRLGVSLIVTCDAAGWDAGGPGGGMAGNWIHLTGPGQLGDLWRIPAPAPTGAWT